MKPTPFEYHQPQSAEEACRLLRDLDDVELMAGNQSLGIVMANRLASPSHLVDISGLEELAGVTVDDDAVHVGALTTHAAIADADDLRKCCELFPEAAEQIAGPAVRNLGTLGGSIGEADPAGNYPTVVVALDADIHLASADEERVVAASDYFVAYMFTELGHDELITGVSVDRGPFPADRTGMAFLELKRAAQTWPTVSAATVVRVDDPDADEAVVEEARVALANADDVPLRVEAAEAAVEGEPLSEATLSAAADAAADAATPEGEMHADPEYKSEVAGEFARRSLRRSYDRATSAQEVAVR